MSLFSVEESFYLFKLIGWQELGTRLQEIALSHGFELLTFQLAAQQLSGLNYCATASPKKEEESETNKQKPGVITLDPDEGHHDHNIKNMKPRHLKLGMHAKENPQVHTSKEYQEKLFSEGHWPIAGQGRDPSLLRCLNYGSTHHGSPTGTNILSFSATGHERFACPGGRTCKRASDGVLSDWVGTYGDRSYLTGQPRRFPFKGRPEAQLKRVQITCFLQECLELPGHNLLQQLVLEENIGYGSIVVYMGWV
ncbi:Peptide methionine sulfoxide reductase MsrA [Varanus komodoensis]|nr:Peptide methionine sulfoxide reductase MsrA [Varanus komodoensis]